MKTLQAASAAAPWWRIGLTGRMASGKGEVVRTLKAHGFRCISLSDFVRREAAKLGPALSRSQMQDLGNRLRRQGGAGVLGKMVREHIAAARPSSWVIDGIRNPAEVDELKRMDRFVLLGIECGVETILSRMRRRGRATDRADEAELRAALAREWGNGEPVSGQRVGATMALADFTIRNDGSLAELKIALEAVLRQLGAGHV